MFLKELQLRDFRNWGKGDFAFSEGLNVLTGRNAQGKTNCVEGVFFLCTGFSPLAGREKQVISFAKQKAEIRGRAETAFGTVTVEIGLTEGKRKSVRVNGSAVAKAGDLLGNVNAVFFNPDELKMIKEAPSDRRRFMDVAISQLNRPYFYALLRYNKILDQRNSLLKDADEQLVYETLPVWDVQLAKEGAYIMKARRDFLCKLAPFAKEAHAYLTQGEEVLTVTSEGETEGTEEEIQANFYRELRDRYEKDRRAGCTTYGPHRDDMKTEINGNDVKTYCSQGQKRTTALSLKLAELEIMRAETGEYPLFILDDVLSELDRERQKRLLQRLDGIQTFLTATHVDEEVFAGLSYRSYAVENGTCTVRDVDGAPAEK